MSSHEQLALATATGDLIFARVSKVGMYYAASVNEVKRDGSLSVTYRDLRKTAIVPRDWILPRDKTDMRSVIPNEVATSRTSSEANSSSSSPVSGERHRSPTHSSIATSPTAPHQAALNGQISSTSDPALVAPPQSQRPSSTREGRRPSLTGPGRRPSLTAVMPPQHPPPEDIPPLVKEALSAPVPGPAATTNGSTTATLPGNSVPSPSPTTLASLPTPPPPPVNQRNKSDVEDWYKAEFGDLLAYTRGAAGNETSEGAGGSSFTYTASSSRRQTASSATIDAALASTFAMTYKAPLEAELLSAEFGICSSYVGEMKEMLESLEASLSSTHQLYETTQRDWAVSTLELKQQLEARAAAARSPSPSPLPVGPTSTDQAATEGSTSQSVEGDLPQVARNAGAQDGDLSHEPDLQRVIEEQEQVILQQLGTVDELTRERDQLRRELAALRREDEGLNRSTSAAKEPDAALVARSLEAKLKAAEQSRSHQQQPYLQEQQSLRMTLNRTMFSPTEDKAEDKSFLVACLEPHQRLVEHKGTVRALALDPCAGETLFSASDDMSVRVWTLQPSQQWKCTQVLTAHEAQVQVVCLHANGNVLFTGDALGTILIWTRSDGGKGPWVRKGAMRVSSQPSITSLVWSSALSAMDPTASNPFRHGLSSTLAGYDRHGGNGGGVLYSGSMDGVLRSWHYSEKRCGGKTKLPGGPITCIVEYSRLLAVGHASGDLALVTMEDLQLLRVAHEAHTRKITSMAVLEHRMFTASHDASIKVWVLPSLECQTSLIGHYSRIECLALSGDGNRLYSGSADMSVMSWDVQGKCVEQGFVEHTDNVSALLAGRPQAISSSLGAVASAAGGAESEVTGQSWLFSGSSDCTIQVWRASDKGFLPLAPPAQQSPRGVRDEAALDYVITGAASGLFSSY